MKLVFPTDPDRIPLIEKAVLKVSPTAKFERHEQYMMYPELAIDFDYRDLVRVAQAVDKAPTGLELAGTARPTEASKHKRAS